MDKAKFIVWVHTGKRKGATATGWDCDTRDQAEKLKADFKSNGSKKVTIEEK